MKGQEIRKCMTNTTCHGTYYKKKEEKSTEAEWTKLETVFSSISIPSK